MKNGMDMKKRVYIVMALMLLTLTGVVAQSYLRQGSSEYGKVLYNWDGRNLRQGSSQDGKVIVNWDGEYSR